MGITAICSVLYCTVLHYWALLCFTFSKKGDMQFLRNYITGVYTPHSFEAGLRVLFLFLFLWCNNNDLILKSTLNKVTYDVVSPRLSPSSGHTLRSSLGNSRCHCHPGWHRWSPLMHHHLPGSLSAGTFPIFSRSLGWPLLWWWGCYSPELSSCRAPNISWLGFCWLGMGRAKPNFLPPSRSHDMLILGLDMQKKDNHKYM